MFRMENLHESENAKFKSLHDKIEDIQRRELDEFFQGKVFNEYGCREFSILGFECEAHQGIHNSFSLP